MTKRLSPNPDGLNRSKNGKGLGVVTRPVTKKRGNSATPDGRTSRALQARGGIDTSTYEGAEQIDPNKPLTDKQRMFVKLWAQGESITSASHKAGYGDGATYAYRMVRMPNVLKLYEAEKRAYEESCQMTRKRVMEGLLDAAEMAKLMAEPASMVSAWREIGKMCGYYEPVVKKIDISVTQNGFKRLEKLTDAELLELISTPAVLEAVQEVGGDDDEQD